MLPGKARNVLIAVNPNSGSRSRSDLVDLLCKHLQEQGLAPEICSKLDLLRDRIQQLHNQQNLAAIVAAGGDGTVSTVATRTPPEIPIAILPLGTENLIAKYLHVACDPKTLSIAIACGSTKQIDCGLANGKLFLVMVGTGFDAQVVLEMSRQRKGHIRHWSYALPIVRSVMQYRFPRLKISCHNSDQSSVWTARWVFVANLPRYAAGLPIASWAESDDGHLDVCTFRDGGVFRSLYYFAFLFFNRHRWLNAFQTCKGTRMRIEQESDSNRPVAYQLDGDFGGELPVDIEVLPNRIKLIVPISDV